VRAYCVCVHGCM